MNIYNWANVSNKKVLVRIDGNVPLHNGIIESDFRLHATLPTLQLLHEKNAEITIITHLGRPKGRDPQLSTKPLQQWFDVQNIKVKVLENLRFDPREKLEDPKYARELADSFDYLVQDAWGALHRHDTSITLLPTCFAPEKKSLGLLVQKEMQHLQLLRNNPENPYLIFLGGGKGETKLDILEKLIQTQKPTTIVILPALCFTFFKALGKPVGKSLIDEAFLPKVKEVVQHAQKNEIEILFPIDVTYLENNMAGAFKTCAINDFPETGIGMGIGPKSLALSAEKVKNTKAIFFNGAMGVTNRPETVESTHELLSIIAQADDTYRVIGGGNSVAEVEKLELFNQLNLQTNLFCSTGGGSTLAYIANEELPGLTAFTQL